MPKLDIILQTDGNISNEIAQLLLDEINFKYKVQGASPFNEKEKQLVVKDLTI